MHQTTIRFGTDLWVALAAAAAVDGISVAQYVRESAVDRLARAAAIGDEPPPAATDRRRGAASTSVGDRAVLVDRAVGGRRASNVQGESSAAVWAQSRLARARATELREVSRVLRGERRFSTAATTESVDRLPGSAAPA